MLGRGSFVLTNVRFVNEVVFTSCLYALVERQIVELSKVAIVTRLLAPTHVQLAESVEPSATQLEALPYLRKPSVRAIAETEVASLCQISFAIPF